MRIVLIDNEGNVTELSDEYGNAFDLNYWNLDKSMARNALGSMVVEAIREAIKEKN